MRLVYLIDRENNRHAGRRGMVDRLHGLRHHVIVRRDDDNRNIRHLRAPGTHGGKRLMTRRIQERDATPVRKFHVISADMLRDTTRLAGDDVRVADIIQQRGLTVVHVSHHGHDRWTGHPILLVILFLIRVDRLHDIRAHVLGLETELLRHDINRLRIQTLVDGNHDTDAHARADDLRNRDVHHIREVVRRDELRQLQYLALLLLQLHQLVLALDGGVTLIATVFSAFIRLAVLARQACQGLLDLLLYILLAHFRLHGLFQARRLAIPPVAVIAIRARIIHPRRIIHIHPVFLDPLAFLFRIAALFARLRAYTRLRGIVRRSLILERGRRSAPRLIRGELLLLIALFSLFLFRFLLRASRLVQRIQVNLSRHLNLRLQSRRIQPEKFLLFLHFLLRLRTRIFLLRLLDGRLLHFLFLIFFLFFHYRCFFFFILRGSRRGHVLYTGPLHLIGRRSLFRLLPRVLSRFRFLL